MRLTGTLAETLVLRPHNGRRRAVSALHVYMPETWGAEPAAIDYAWYRGQAEPRRGQAPLAQMPKADRLTVVLPASLVLLTCVRVPQVRGRRLAQLLPFAVEEKLMCDPEAIHVAPGPRLPSGEFPVAVVDRTYWNALVVRLREARLFPQAIIPESLSVPVEQGQWGVVWKGGGGFVRTGETSGFALDGAPEGAPPYTLGLALSEAAAQGSAPRELVLRAVGGQAPDVRAWEGMLGVPVRLAEPAGSAEYLPARGAAINLAPGMGIVGAAWFTRERLLQLRPALWAAAALLLLAVGGEGLATLKMAHEAKRLRADMLGSFRRAFPETTAIVDPVLQMRRNLMDLRHAHGQLDPRDFLPLLARAASALAPARLTALTYAAGTLTLDVALPNEAGAALLQRRLLAAGFRVRARIERASHGVNIQLRLSRDPT